VAIRAYRGCLTTAGDCESVHALPVVDHRQDPARYTVVFDKFQTAVATRTHIDNARPAECFFRMRKVLESLVTISAFEVFVHRLLMNLFVFVAVETVLHLLCQGAGR
jgi:hypothetical protein